MLGEDLLPNEETQDCDETNSQGNNNVCRAPRVLLSTPVQTNQEGCNSSDTQKCTKEIHAVHNLSLGQSDRSWPWWWLVPNEENSESEESHAPNDESNPVPALLGQKLSIKGGRGEWQESEDDVTDSDTTLVGRHQLRDCSNGGEQLDTNSDTRKNHGGNGSCDVWRGSEQDHGYSDQPQTKKRNTLATDQINERTNERHNRTDGDELGDEKPDSLLTVTEVVSDDGEKRDEEQRNDFCDDEGQTEA